MLAAIALAAALLRGSVLVEGTTSCPTPAEVEALVLRGMGDDQRSDRAELIVSGGRLSVRLLDRAGALVTQRELNADALCASLAAAAAAVINAMELQLRSPPQVGIGAIHNPAEPTPQSQGSASRTERAPPPPPRLTFAVGALFLGSIADDALAPGGALTVGLGFQGSSFRLESGFFAEAPRQLVLDGGAASYQRSWLSIGAGYAVGWRDFAFEGQLAVLGGVTSLMGDGKTSKGSGTILEPGGALGLTAQWSFGVLAISTGPLLLLWPGGNRVEIVGLHQSQALPQWDGLWSVGLRFGSG